MANRLPWFKHCADAHEDEFIRRLIEKYGHFGYASYFILLELLHKHGSGNELKISPKRVCKELCTRQDKLREFLGFCQGFAKVKFDWSQDEVRIEIKKFREYQHNLLVKSKSKVNQKSIKSSIEGEREGEREGEVDTTTAATAKTIISYFAELRGIRLTTPGLKSQFFRSQMKDAMELSRMVGCDLELAKIAIKEIAAWLDRKVQDFKKTGKGIDSWRHIRAIVNNYVPWKAEFDKDMENQNERDAATVNG